PPVPAVSAPGGTPLAIPPTPTPVRDGDDIVAAPARTWVRRLVVSVIVLAVVAGILFGGARYALQNSWYVGVNDEGLVTIYQGRPEEIAGLSLSEVEEVTSIQLDNLPDYLHDDLAEGIKVDSLEEAEEAVANLESRARTSPRRT
ncbi:MAG: BofC C-terminal domain-containing protein, partial [Dehalococcoidia bacterium]